MKYIALTIGPIYKTLSNAKKTRELWGGSYIFSYIMKEIIKKFQDREFIVPYVDKNILEKPQEIGLFHDRMIFEAKNGDKEKMKQVIDEVFFNISKHSDIDKEFLKEYFQLHYNEFETNKNPIVEISPYLDTMELMFQVTNQENKLQKFLKNRINKSFLVEDAFGKKRTSFPSLPEIALSGIDKNLIEKVLNSEKVKKDELEIYEDERIKPLLKPYHKYIAIIQADGDNMSKVINSLETKNDFKIFSNNLFKYCQKSNELIDKFGGITIFAGGDDLLFFAPVISKNGDTIFNLCNNISNSFNEIFKEYNTTPKPTLSFGVNITYYKYPLYEALENARYLLFAKAKNKNRNNIAFQVTKHSGQSFDAVIHKGNEKIYKEFLKFVKIISNEKDDTNFLHSIHHKIDSYKTILETIKNDKAKLENFFDNYFNENEHNEYREFFDSLIDFIYISQDLNMVYSTLRFIKFVKGDKK